ncbi:MAG TPA: hypothetical protein VGI39_35675 [Polyangiaceae bacterium]|jgi:hypothetical protein
MTVDGAPALPGSFSLLGRLSDLGSAAQASIPGLYAWSVTVAPAAWARGAPVVAKVFALMGLGALAAALFLEQRRAQEAARARAVAVWGLALSAAATWLIVPSEMSTLRMDGARGVAGMLGWGLFAFACAAPPARREPASQARVVEGPPLRPRTRLARGDVAILTLGAVIAGLLQIVGWRSGPSERAVLVRLVVIACGISILGAATGVALARHARRSPPSRKERLRRSFPWLTTLSLLLSTRLLVWFFMGT